MTIVEMIDEIDRLVSNSGTISQIKPVIIPLREQAEALEKRVRTLESKSKVKNLEGQVDFLRAQLDAALQQIQGFKDRENKPHSLGHSEDETQILLFLSGNDGLTTKDIAGAVAMSAQIVEFHLIELEKKEFIFGAHRMGGPSAWHLAQEGRRYLIENGKLK